MQREQQLESSLMSSQDQLKFHIKITFLNFIYKTKLSVQFQMISKFISIQYQIQTKMSKTTHLSDLWEHTIAKAVNHDSKSELGLMLKQQGNKGMLKTFLLTVSSYSKLLQRSAFTNYCIDLLADKVHWNKLQSLQCYISHIPIRK